MLCPIIVHTDDSVPKYCVSVDFRLGEALLAPDDLPEPLKDAWVVLPLAHSLVLRSELLLNDSFSVGENYLYSSE